MIAGIDDGKKQCETTIDGEASKANLPSGPKTSDEDSLTKPEARELQEGAADEKKRKAEQHDEKSKPTDEPPVLPVCEDPLIYKYKALMEREVQEHGRAAWLKSDIRKIAIQVMPPAERKKRKFD